MSEAVSHDVIVCIHNGFEDVKMCLASLQEYWDSETLRSLILVDDKSTSQTADYVKTFVNEHKIARLVRLDTQHYYTRAANIGLQLSDATYITLLNSDTIVTEGWAQNIRKVFEKSPDVGIVGPLSNAASTQSLPMVKSRHGQTAINILPNHMTPSDFARTIRRFSDNLTTPYVPVVHGFCYTIHRNVIDAIGYFDEVNFPRGYGEENDYSFRCEDAGYALAIALDSYVFHAKSRSYTSEEQQTFSKAGHEALAEKYSNRRIQNTIATMENHPSLVAMRETVKRYWPEHQWLATDIQDNEVVA